MNQKSNWPFRYDLLQRYRLIEIVALWEGKLNAGHLTDYFGIGRQQASKDINEYRNNIGPDNLIYNSSLKGYEPSDNFAPKVTLGEADEYLQLIHRNSDLMNTFHDMTLGFDYTHNLPLPKYRVQPTVLRQVVKACRNKLRLEVDYRSVNAPDKAGRIIVPHSIVHSGMRWHVRGFCEKNQDYRDFVLTRFYGTPEVMGKSNQSIEQDTAWQTKVNVVFIPDQRLSDAQQEVVANDFGMTNQSLLIQVRGALVQYLLQMMRIDMNVIAADPRAQQVVIQNMDAVKQWLFK
ncbi:WYL domain-containing protein [Aliiglaciecola sp. 3_MG-2023]|uniref:WYL domain-containing protein n=1 Tax=Aliiglaciecola sp. 3_MG-2023 TaxID=3062644 RepID=UPI0026E326FC|nr:WYL domain-containing protein [Aliiglaciecola sp. 3_MG-2023]MDO6694521.1 WYL domain-containing protein [Aliiglaciecola sp. 3_MG-2023]